MDLIPSLRNLLRPVNWLPPEVLSRVARFVPCADASDARSIIPLTHVCRYWRGPIISAPEHWALISSSSPIGLTKLSLERCKAASLELRLEMPEVRRNSGFSDLILPHIQNTETLRLDRVSTFEELKRILQSFPRSTSNLRSLSLSREWGGNLNWPNETCGPLSSTLTRLDLLGIPLSPSFLGLRTLTSLTLHTVLPNLHLNTLLDFLEENRSLERVTLNVKFAQRYPRSSRRRVVIDRLRHLSMHCHNLTDFEALIPCLSVQRGGHLEITVDCGDPRLNEVLPLVSTTRFPNLRSPTSMVYETLLTSIEDQIYYYRNIQLLGPNGSSSFDDLTSPDEVEPFIDFPLLPLTDVLEFRLIRLGEVSAQKSLVFDPSFFPALETLAVHCDSCAPHLFSTLFSNPSFPPRLKTLAFLDCDLTEVFISELTRFASNREKSTSARLDRIVIINSEGILPSVVLINELRKHVRAVDVRVGEEFPSDLT